jgi:hypothetical protein
VQEAGDEGDEGQDKGGSLGAACRKQHQPRLQQEQLEEQQRIAPKSLH